MKTEKMFFFPAHTTPERNGPSKLFVNFYHIESLVHTSLIFGFNLNRVTKFYVYCAWFIIFSITSHEICSKKKKTRIEDSYFRRKKKIPFPHVHLIEKHTLWLCHKKFAPRFNLVFYTFK